MASRRNYTKGTLEHIRRRKESGASISQDEARALREADVMGASGRSTGGVASVRRGGRIETPGAEASRVINGPRRNDPRNSGSANPFRVRNTLRDVLNEQAEARGDESSHPGGFPGGQGRPADASTPESPGGGRKRTGLPMDSDGINETRYMREFREKNKNVGDAFGKIGGSLTKRGSFAFRSDGNGGLRSGLPHWNEDAFRRAEADRRRRIMDSIESNRSEGLAAGARVLENLDKFSARMDAVASGRDKLNPADAVQAMKGIMRDAQTNVGMRDRKFSSGQGFSEGNQRRLDDFAGTLVDKAASAVESRFNADTDPSLAEGRRANRMMHGDLKQDEYDSDWLRTEYIDKGDARQYQRAVGAKIQSTKDFINSSQVQSRHTKEFIADSKAYREQVEKEMEQFKKQMGQADWGGGISDRARRFIDRRRSETSGALARFLAGREVA